jgi:hypothetical protein
VPFIVAERRWRREEVVDNVNVRRQWKFKSFGFISGVKGTIEPDLGGKGEEADRLLLHGEGGGQGHIGVRLVKRWRGGGGWRRPVTAKGGR